MSETPKSCGGCGDWISCSECGATPVETGAREPSEDFGPALSEFVAIAAFRIANRPSANPSDDEMAAYHRVVAAFRAARPTPDTRED
jgi:hypothetical protein